MSRFTTLCSAVALFLTAGHAAAQYASGAFAPPSLPPTLTSSLTPTTMEGAAPSATATTTVAQPSENRFWVRGEYIAWTIGTAKMAQIGKEAFESANFNALLAAAGTNFKNITETGLGDERTGYRIGAGMWLDDANTFGVEVGFLYVNRPALVAPIGQRDRTNRPAIFSNLGLPGIDPNDRFFVIPFNDSSLVNGNVTFNLAEKTLWYFDLLGRVRFYDCCDTHVDGLIGYRRLYYGDSFSSVTQAVTLGPPLRVGTKLTSVDWVTTSNTYDGALFGLDMQSQSGSWFYGARATATVAYLNASFDRGGETDAIHTDGRRQHFRDGVFVLASESGHFSTNECTVIPQLDLWGGYTICEQVKVFLGTSLLYLPSVARATNQIELGLNQDRTLPGRVGAFQPANPSTPNLRSVFMTTLSVGVAVGF
jgi:Putative beta barrel porin-7 (BBP7)